MKHNVDLDVLDELVGLCEDAIVRPFKKAKPVPKAEPKPANDELSDEDLELLGEG